MTRTNDLTEESRQRLREELEVLRARRRALSENADPDQVGDRADDAEALRRYDDVAQLDDRIAELTRLLAGARPPGWHGDAALPVDTRVTLRFPDGGTETMRVVALTEQARPGEEDSTLTLDSPLGEALAGAREGETVRFEAPDGTHEVEVVRIDRP